MNKIHNFAFGATLISSLFLFSALPGYAGNQKKNKPNFTNSNRQSQQNRKKFKYIRHTSPNSARSNSFRTKNNRRTTSTNKFNKKNKKGLVIAPELASPISKNKRNQNKGLVLGDGNTLGNKRNLELKKRKDLVLNGLGVKGNSNTKAAKSSKKALNIQNYKTTKVKKPAPKGGVVFEVETTLKKGK